MTSLQQLPSDQRAVLELVLARGRNYDEIATMLSIDRAGVRQRALAAFDALGPQSDIAPERRALITDYLLGQLPSRVSADVHARLARETADRDWADALATELEQIAAEPLPEVPEAETQAPEPVSAQVTGTPGRADAPRGASASGATGMPAARPTPPRSSRRGGALLLAVGALVVVAVIVVVVIAVSASSGGGKHSSSSSVTPSASSSTATSSTAPTIVARVSLSPPSKTSKAQGIAEAFSYRGKGPYLAIVAAGLPANSHDYYGVWLSNSAHDNVFLGDTPAVGSNGQLQTGTPTPLSGTQITYKQVLVTRDTQQKQSSPGSVVLRGPLNATVK